MGQKFVSLLIIQRWMYLCMMLYIQNVYYVPYVCIQSLAAMVDQHDNIAAC